LVSTSFNLAGLLILPVIFFFLHRWPKAKVEIIETSRVGIIRRIAAFYVDMVVGMIGVLPIICMTSLTIEYIETGQWAWSFSRDYFRPSDILGVAIFLLGFFGIFYYSKWHFVRRPIWPWTIMKRKQDYWWDKASKIKARKVTKI